MSDNKVDEKAIAEDRMAGMQILQIAEKHEISKDVAAKVCSGVDRRKTKAATKKTKAA